MEIVLDSSNFCILTQQCRALAHDVIVAVSLFIKFLLKLSTVVKVEARDRGTGCYPLELVDVHNTEG